MVALPGVGQMPAAGDDEHEEARIFYVAATRATERLLITVSGVGGLGGGFPDRFANESRHSIGASAALLADARNFEKLLPRTLTIGATPPCHSSQPV